MATQFKKKVRKHRKTTLWDGLTEVDKRKLLALRKLLAKTQEV